MSLDHAADTSWETISHRLAEMLNAGTFATWFGNATAIEQDQSRLVVGVPNEPLNISALQIVLNKQRIQGWPSGSAIDSEDTLRFSVLTGVRPLIERYPLEKVAEAYHRMLSGKARFRVILTMGS